MRTIIWISLAIVCVGPLKLSAQDPEPLSRTALKLSPQHFFQNSLKAGVEHFNRDHSRSLAIFITGMLGNNEDLNYRHDGYNALAGELQLRKYVSPMKWKMSKRGNPFHHGVYGAVYLQGGSYSGTFRDEYQYTGPDGRPVWGSTYNYHEVIGNWGGGFTIGYQKTLWQVIFLEAFIGGGIQFSDVIRSGQQSSAFYTIGGITDPGYKGILPKVGLNVGIAL